MLIPEAVAGDWSVEHLQVSESAADFENIRAAIKGRPFLRIVPGTYQRLIHKNELITSDAAWYVIYRNQQGQVLGFIGDDDVPSYWETEAEAEAEAAMSGHILEPISEEI